MYGTWKSMDVVTKLFVSTKYGEKDFKRDARGAKILTAANILTSRLLYDGHLLSSRIPITIFERIHNATDFSRVWESAQSLQEQAELLQQLIQVLAQHHNAGITHNDPNFTNFLVMNGKIYTLDGSSVSKRWLGRPLRKQSSLDNLSRLFRMCPPYFDRFLEDCFAIYANQRGWAEQARTLQRLRRIIDKDRLSYIEKRGNFPHFTRHVF